MSKLNDMMTRLYIRLTSKKEGQGVIEYAGAMIVAALIVAAVLVIGQTGMTNVYNSIFTGVEGFFQTQAAAI